MLTYIFEGDFNSAQIWDILEDYFVGKIPDKVKAGGGFIKKADDTIILDAYKKYPNIIKIPKLKKMPLKKQLTIRKELQARIDRVLFHLKSETTLLSEREKLITKALPLSACLKEQNLVCNMAEMKSSRYRAKAMLRLFRKMFMAGVRVLGNPFKDSVCDRKHKFIWSYVYFPELMVREEKQRDLKLKQKIEKLGYKCTVENRVVRIHTEYADYTFEIFDKRMEGQYTAHRFYKGERTFQVHFEQKLSMEQKIEKVIRQIKKIEKQAAYGVGNDEIAGLLEKITGCSEYGCRS